MNTFSDYGGTTNGNSKNEGSKTTRHVTNDSMSTPILNKGKHNSSINLINSLAEKETRASAFQDKRLYYSDASIEAFN